MKNDTGEKKAMKKFTEDNCSFRDLRRNDYSGSKEKFYCISKDKINQQSLIYSQKDLDFIARLFI